MKVESHEIDLLDGVFSCGAVAAVSMWNVYSMRGLNFHPAKLAQDGFVPSRCASRTCGFYQQTFGRA
jgi:hypothetical protein